MIAFSLSREKGHFCPGNGKSIPLGINQHWIVVAQSVRKGAPLNPDAPETGKTTMIHYK